VAQNGRVGTQEVIQRPPFVSVPLATGLKWSGGGGHRFEQKLDGVTAIREVTRGGYRAKLWGEAMRDGRFYAVDVLEYAGQNLRVLPRRESLVVLDDLTARLGLLRPAVGHGGEFVEAIIASAGEGVVASVLDAPWFAPRWKCKRVETFDCVITETDEARGSIRLALAGEDCGWCPAKAAFDSLRVGDVVEVAAHSRHVSGRFREARFVRVRMDKACHTEA